MTDFYRTPESNFDKLNDYEFEPHYHEWGDLRMHYLDEGPKDGPVMLLVHGMPTWSYLYRDFIPKLSSAGFRCVVPDHFGFGKSDKPIDPYWYSIARHTEVLTSLITALDLRDITLVCQDWGGPIGLAQAATMPDRFSRLAIMNTWLHHPEFHYSEAIKRWNNGWHEGGLFARETPNIGALIALSGGLLSREEAVAALISGAEPSFGTAAGKHLYDAYRAPFRGLPDEAYNGLRRFPLSIPFDDYHSGNGAAQTLHFNLLRSWTKPIHFIWGGADDIFTESWGRQWASIYTQSTFHLIADAGHFLQNTHGNEIAERILSCIEGETLKIHP
jgi:haloalkane dehalogenase